MKPNRLSRLLAACALFAALFSDVAFAQAIKDWKGQSANSDWNEPANWSPVGVPATADVVRIGVVAFNQPAIAINSSVRCAAMEFGTSAQATVTINSPGKLTVAGGIMIDSKAGLTQDARFTTSFSGTGMLEANFIQVGDDLQPATTLVGRAYMRVSFDLTDVYLRGNLIINSVSNDGTGTYYPEFYVNSGTLTLDGQIVTQNKFSYIESYPAGSVPQYRSMFRLSEEATNSAAVFRNIEPIRALAAGHCIDFIGAGSGVSNIIYENNSTTPQIVYPAFDVPVGQQPFNYKSIEFRGSGPKTVYGNPLSGTGGTITIGTNFTAEGGK
ncbi:MAG: hypothetical protein INR69_20715, partial [Mucilaginibacter polytrichastri]|nr:hypothetical protein [Mucilaginibacter polytrichastri]